MYESTVITKMKRSSIPVVRRRGRRGSALIELSISFLGFMMLMFGVFDFSWAVYAQTFCYAEAQDAVRWASVRGSESSSPATANDIQTYVRSQAVGLTKSSITVTSCWFTAGTSTGCPGPNGNNSPGSNVQVTVSYPISPLSGVAIRTGFTVSAKANTVINN